MEELRQLILYIQNVYDSVNEEWENSGNYMPINMKSAKVKDFYDNSVFLNYAFDYRNFIDDNVGEIFNTEFNRFVNTVNSRVKAVNSIQSKINKYAVGKKEHGEVSINKCLNDIFGIRIIFDDRIDYKEIERFIKNAFPDLKCILANREKYSAVHVYFGKGSNRRFQWELQIWDKNHEKTNLLSHAKHKQDYAKWEKR